MARKIANKNSPGTPTTFAADDWDLQNKLLTGVDQSASDPVHINTDWYFRSGRARFYVPNYPTNTFYYSIVAQQITANRILNLPLVTDTDEFAVLNMAQILSNKTYSLTSNTLTDTGASLGGIPAHNGTRYLNRNIGTPGQVPTVNVGGTDWTWAEPTSTATIADDSVSTAKIQNLAVTNAKLFGSISGDKILDNAVSNAKMADASVGTAELIDGAVTSAKISTIGGVPPFMTQKTWGMASGQNTTTGGATGILDPLTLIRTHSRSLGSLFGNIFVGTGTTIDTLAGQRTTNPYTRRIMNPKLFVRFDVSPITNTRIFLGWSTSSSITNATSNFLDGQHGIGLMLPANGTTFRVVRNDGSATDTEVSAAYPAIVATPISFYVEMNDAVPSATIKIWTANNGDASGTPDKEETFTTVLPSSTSNLYFHMVISNSTTTESFIGREAIYVENKW